MGNIVDHSLLQASAITVTADNNLLVAAQTGLKLCGYNVKATVGSAGVGMLIKGVAQTQTNTNRIAGFNLATGAHDHEWFGDDGVKCDEGISVDFTSGSFDVTVFYRVAP